MKELELLQQKLEQLIKRYAALQASVARLEKSTAQQAEVISRQQEAIDQLQKELQLRSVVISTSVTHTGPEKEKLKQHLDQVIREIEKNLELL